MITLDINVPNNCTEQDIRRICPTYDSSVHKTADKQPIKLKDKQKEKEEKDE